MGRRITVGLVLVMIFIGVFSTHISFSMAQNVEKGEKAIIWIHNVYDLQNMSKNLSGNYALANDIDAMITKTWNNGSGFVPVGNNSAPFNGTFDGNGHKIINLWINRSSRDYVGLFGYTTSNAKIENVGLVNVSVSGSCCVGGLVGVNYGTVGKSYATGNVSGRSAIGGLIGLNKGPVSNSYSTGNVNGDWDVGGLVGVNGDTVNNSYSTGNVNGDWDVGGLVGVNYGTVGKSYATGNVSGGEDVGGLVGYNDGTVGKSYATGNVSGGGDVGGLVGVNYGTVGKSYATGNVSGSGWHVGGLVGVNDGPVNNSYSTGNVNGSGRAGGLIGLNIGKVSNSYSTGNVSGDWHVGGLVGENWDTVKNSHYDVDRVLINGGHYLTIGGIFDSQYNDWISHDLTLDIANYPSLVPDGEYYDISDVQGIKDMLGFCEDGLKFKLVADIDLSSEPNLYIPYFEGVFDGNNHTISNLSVQISFGGEIGLFGFNRGIIKDIGALNVNVSGSDYVGGLVGWNYYGTVNNSYSTGNVSGGYAGGLVGYNYYGMVSNSYATGSVSGDYSVGGLVGRNYGTVSNSYATGSVSGSGNVGGLVGENSGTVTASFWDADTSGIDYSDGGTGLHTAQMKNKTTFLNAGWDFTNTWDMVDGQTYPFFKWQKPSKPSPPLYLHAMAGDGFVNLTWTNPSFDGASPIIKYIIYRNGTKIAEVPATQLYYNDTTVVNGVTYTYYVTAVNSVGESDKSNEVQATPMGVPSSPQNINAKSGDGYVNLSWNAPSDDGGSPITEYRIYRNGSLIATVSANQLWYNDTDVVNGVTYTYYVTAVNSVGESPKSNEVSATPGGTIPEITPGAIIIVALLSLIIALRKRRN